MSVGDAVRSRINTVELALKEAGTDSAVNAIVDVLKEIARALDAIETPEKELSEPKKPWDYSKGIDFV